MRGSLLGGLALALGSLLHSANAQEIQWRPTGAKDPAPPAFQSIRTGDSNGSTPVKVGLRPPTTINRPAPVVTDSQVTPVSLFQPVKIEVAEPVVKAQASGEDLKPLPFGPVLDQAPVQKGGAEAPKTKLAETAPMPRPLPEDQLEGIPPTTGFQPIPEEGMMMGEGEIMEEGGWGGDFWGFPCCSIPRCYASAEYLMWGLNDPNLPPLITTTNLSQTQINALANTGIRPGAIGQLGTQTLFAEENFDGATFSGGRFTLGFHKLCHECALEGTFFFLGEARTDFFAQSNAANPQFLFLPFFDTNRAVLGENALVVATPTNPGFVSVRYASRIWGAEANLRKAWWCDGNSKLDMLAGFRFVELTEALDLECSCFVPAGSNLSSIDSFGTRNRFFGGQIGADYEHRHGRWILGAAGKIAIGGMHQSVRIDGSSFSTNTAGVSVARSGSFFTAPSNIGRYQQEDFAVVPELQLKLGYQITDNLSAYVGYNLLYMSSVARPGDQIDRSFDPRAGGQGPIFVFQDTDFWAQGFNAGLNLKY